MSQATREHSTAAAVLPAPSRRSLVGAGAALLLGGAAGTAGFVKPPPLPWRNGPRPAPQPTPGGDASLVSDCQALVALERRVVALYTSIEDDDARDAPLDFLQARQRPLLDRICATPALSPDGVRAKAAALAAWAPDHLKPPADACWDERLLASLLADLTAGGMPA